MFDMKLVDSVLATVRNAEATVDSALKMTHAEELINSPLVKTFVPQLSAAFTIGNAALTMVTHLTESAQTGAVVFTSTQKAEVEKIGDSLRQKAVDLNTRVQALT